MIRMTILLIMLMMIIMTITISSNHNDSDHTTTNDVNRNIAIHVNWGPHKPTPPPQISFESI